MSWLKAQQNGSTFQKNEALSADYGVLRYDDYSYDEPLSTYDYRIHGKDRSLNIWGIAKGTGATWTKETVAS